MMMSTRASKNSAHEVSPLLSLTESGSAIIIVLWILLLLSIMALNYSSDTRLRAITAANQIDSIKNQYTKKSALQRGLYEYDKYVANQSLFARKEEIETSTGNTLELWWPRYKPYLLQNSYTGTANKLAVQVVSVDARFNINTISASLLERILTVCGLDDEDQRNNLKDALLDWVDADDLHHHNGAETEYYQQLVPAYVCKNNKIQLLAEMLLLRGMTSDIFYGTTEHPGLIDFLTTYSTAGTAADKVDINCASPALFKLITGLEDDEKNDILAYRETKYIKKISELATITSIDVYSQIQKYFKIVNAPAYVRIAVSMWPTTTKTSAWYYNIHRLK